MATSSNQARLTQPLRDEHRELLPHIEELQAVADSIGVAPSSQVQEGVAAAHAFLTQHLMPHAQAEEQALYPAVQKAMGAPEATSTMSRDHVAIRRLTDELTALRQSPASDTINEGQARDLRRVLYGLYALVKVHFAKEEEVYLPLLDARLTPADARGIFERMEAAAMEAKAKAATT